MSLFELELVMDDSSVADQLAGVREDVASLLGMVNALSERVLELVERVDAIEHLVRRLERKAELD